MSAFQEESKKKLLRCSGPIVTGAGLMMALSFGGNLLAESIALNQAGWILGVGVLVDTFVVRSLLVPALISLADGAAWWPRRPKKHGLMDEYGHAAQSVWD